MTPKDFDQSVARLQLLSCANWYIQAQQKVKSEHGKALLQKYIDAKPKTIKSIGGNTLTLCHTGLISIKI